VDAVIADLVVLLAASADMTVLAAVLPPSVSRCAAHAGALAVGRARNECPATSRTTPFTSVVDGRCHRVADDAYAARSGR